MRSYYPGETIRRLDVAELGGRRIDLSAHTNRHVCLGLLLFLFAVLHDTPTRPHAMTGCARIGRRNPTGHQADAGTSAFLLLIWKVRAHDGDGQE